jgi:Spy/CpxP family protein refolding chaperone
MERQISSLAFKMDANQEKMEAIVHSIRSEQNRKMQHRIKNILEWQEILKEEGRSSFHEGMAKRINVMPGNAGGKS